jgi:diaminohydroxyphosphoribosylaminopyrimidine deaminase/5-amino-6-(5-phosphoribosylamino)uracil reductase
MIKIEGQYMRRALELAAHGLGNTSPNPMVGAVIVHQGRIIGEGYHRRLGQGHAEVNAIASVADADRHLLADSTIYVTLEPCSHYGKTPPCAKLIIERRIPRVVVGAVDPFEKVSGRGIAMLRDSGIEVVSGVLDEECRRLNRRFFTAHTQRRPFITLKWARSADGFMDHRRLPGSPAYRFSTPLTSLLTARLRSLHDAIITSAATVNADNPRLNVRGWDGRDPVPVIIDRSGKLNRDRDLASRGTTIISSCPTIQSLLSTLYSRGITSALVEGGPRLLNAFIGSDLWDEARVETSPVTLASQGACPAPQLGLMPEAIEDVSPNWLTYYRHP